MTSPTFGIWAPVYGYEGVQGHPDDPIDASYRRSRDLAVAAEGWGYDTILLAQHISNPALPGGDILETWTAAAAIAEATSRIEVIAAIKSFLFNPGVLAKMALGIDAISEGRFAINLISGWYLPEIEELGLPLHDHDERYRYSDEWLSIVRALWQGERVVHHGPNFTIDGLELAPRPVRPGGPRVYVGGLSDPAQQLAAEQSEVFLLNGRPVAEAAALVETVRRKAIAAGNPQLRFGMAPFIIARETAQEAEAEFAALLALRVHDDNSLVASGLDPKTVLFDANVHQRPKIGSNGGTEAGLVGSYEQVAERMAAFVAVGIDVFLIQAQPIERELERIAREVLPRVRALTAAAPGRGVPA